MVFVRFPAVTAELAVMNNCCPFAHIMRKILFFALMGVAVVFLTGPVVAVISFVVSAGLFVFFFLLPFALLGFLIWLPIRLICGRGASARKTLVRTTQIMGHAAFVMPARTCGHLQARARTLGDRIHALTSFIGAVFVEAASGALVGAMVGAIAGWQTGVLSVSIPAGAVIGLGLGVIVGTSRLRQTPETLSGQISD
ncbi:MAG TPA: hypothetical protein VGY58_07625 [Gemmataceae bacterium]|nr:hypothetical protein [Gemmataceae bacterium]